MKQCVSSGLLPIRAVQQDRPISGLLAYLGGLGGLLKDEREAVRLFRLSADQGNSRGQLDLGYAYQRALGGLPKDEQEAARLYRLAADQGNAAAQSFLARLNRDPPATK